MSLCVHNAHVVTPLGVRRGGVLVDDEGRIAALLDGAAGAAADVVVDARERLLFAGFVDAHVHMRDPGLTHREDYASGTRAAAVGGVTTVMCMPNTDPPIDSAERVRATASTGTGRAHVDFTLQATIPAALEPQMAAIWAAGITSFETSLADGQEGVGTDRLDDPARLLDVLRVAARLDATVGILAGSQPITDRLTSELRAAGATDSRAFAAARPPVTEALGIAVLVEAARETGARLVFRQVTTARGVELLRRARAELGAARIGVELCPHNLHLTLDAVDRVGAWAQIIPPLRTEPDVAAARVALADATADFVGSDHAPHAPYEKEGLTAWEARNGTPGLDTVAAAVLDLALAGHVPLPRVAEVLGAGPAQVFGIADRKGSLQPGHDGDLVLVDPDVVRLVTPDVILSKPGRSAFEGVRLRGWPVLTVLRGAVVAEAGEVVGSPRGRFLARAGQPER
jgi:dihydroorotase (multifunctional complex type)